MTKPLALMIAVGMASLMAFGNTAQAQEPNLPAGERTFNRLDKNKDSKLSIEEVQPRVARGFKRLDKDRDGNVSAAEIEQHLKEAMERRRDRILANMDGDTDGMITAIEIDAFIAKQFGAADADKDGGVALQELQAYYAERRKQAFQEMRASRTDGEGDADPASD